MWLSLFDPKSRTYRIYFLYSVLCDAIFFKSVLKRMTRLCMWCRVRVANELGAGNGRGAKFATAVAVTQSIVIGLFFWILIIFFHNELALIFSTSQPVLEAVHKLSILLAFTVLLNSVQPILSGKFTAHFFRFELYIHIKKIKNSYLFYIY